MYKGKPADLQEAMKTVEFPFYDDPKKQIESDYQPDAIKELSNLAEAFNDDYPTKKLIEKWIDGEKEHMAWEAQYLYLIDKIGYEKCICRYGADSPCQYNDFCREYHLCL